MRFSLSSWMMRRAHKGLAALTLGATTLTFTGCVGMPSGMAMPSNPNTPFNGTGQMNGNGPGPNGLMQVNATMPGNPPVQQTVPGTPLPPLPPGTPVGQPANIYTYWDKELQVAPDPTQHGLRVPCLVGRMIMFGANSKEVCQDGTLTVTLFDERPPQGGPPVALERWVLDKANLRKLINRDAMHLWGYTLPMPTAAYRPSMTLVRMDLEFVPENGNPIYQTSGPIRMQKNASEARHEVVPGTAFNQVPAQPQPRMQPQSQADQIAQQLLQSHGFVGQQPTQPLNPQQYQGQPQPINPQQYQGQPQPINPQQYQGQGQPQPINPQQYQGQGQGQPQPINPQLYQGQGQPQSINPQQYQGQGQPQSINPQQYQGQPPQQYQGQPQPISQPQYPYQGQAQPPFPGQPQQGMQPQQMPPVNGNYGVPPGTLPVQPVNGVPQQRAGNAQIQYQGFGQ